MRLGNYQYRSVIAQKYEDWNADGKKQAAEPWLPDWEMSLDGGAPEETDANGRAPSVGYCPVCTKSAKPRQLAGLSVSLLLVTNARQSRSWATARMPQPASATGNLAPSLSPRKRNQRLIGCSSSRRTSTPQQLQLKHDQTEVFVPVNPGTYNVTEIQLAGWTLESITCE